MPRDGKEYIDPLMSGMFLNKFLFEHDLLSKKYFLTKMPPNVLKIVLAMSEKKFKIYSTKFCCLYNAVTWHIKDTYTDRKKEITG